MGPPGDHVEVIHDGHRRTSGQRRATFTGDPRLRQGAEIRLAGDVERTVRSR
jgi:hypothetical protein